MSDIKDLTVHELIHILQGTYRAIDLRTMLLKERTEWNCVFFVLRMTIQEKVKLNSLHENKRSLLTGGHPDVQIVYESRDPTDINSIIGQINNRNIYLEGYSKYAKLKRVRKIEREKTETANSYALSDDVGFPHEVLRVLYDPITSPYIRLENHGVTASDFNLRWLSDLNSCFDVTNLREPCYLIFVFPVYAKILECIPNKLEEKLFLKFQIHDILFSGSKMRIEVRSSPYNRLVDTREVKQPQDIKKESNRILTVSTSERISSFEHGTSGMLRIVHEKLGEMAFQSFELPTENIPGDFHNLDMDQSISELPPLPIDYQLNDLLKEAGIEYNLLTRELKITTDDYAIPLPLPPDNLIDTKFEDPFYDSLK